MTNDSFIKIYRKINNWGWRHKPITFSVFLHLLINASYKSGFFEGVRIERGQVVVGRKKTAETLGLSEMQFRTALNHLKSTNEITIKTTNKYSIISITNYEIYQGCNQQVNQQITNKQPTNNQQITTSKESKKVIKKEDIQILENIPNDLWNDFLQVRKSKKAPMTETALNILVSQAKKANWTLEEALQECVARNWQSFKAEWVKQKSPPQRETSLNKLLMEGRYDEIPEH